MQHLAQFALSVLSLITGEFKINGFLSLGGISVLLFLYFNNKMGMEGILDPKTRPPTPGLIW